MLNIGHASVRADKPHPRPLVLAPNSPRHQVKSVSKSIHFDRDDLISAYLPFVKDTPYHQARLIDLVTHTACLPHDDDYYREDRDGGYTGTFNTACSQGPRECNQQILVNIFNQDILPDCEPGNTPPTYADSSGALASKSIIENVFDRNWEDLIFEVRMPNSVSTDHSRPYPGTCRSNTNVTKRVRSRRRVRPFSRIWHI